MEILDLGKISRDIENKNQEFNIIYDKEFRKFENNLLYEIEDLLRYYRIRINPSELESMIESIIPMLKNQSGYKKIMNKNLEILSDLMHNSNINIQEAKEFSIKEQESINRTSNLEACIMDIIKIFRSKTNYQINGNSFDELISITKKQIIKLNEIINELNNELIKDNASLLSTEKDNDMSNEKQNFDDYKKAVQTLPSDKLIQYLDNEFSMIEPNVAINYINRLKFELPFGRIDVEEYLKNKENELKEILKQEQSEKSVASDFL